MEPFEPEKIVVQEYPITEMQPVYFLADSFEIAQEKLRWITASSTTIYLLIHYCCYFRAFAATIPRQYDLRYNPYTQSVEVLDNKNAILKLAGSIQNDAELVQKALKKVIWLWHHLLKYAKLNIFWSVYLYSTVNL